MNGDLGELLGLFLDEARERLVRLARVAPAVAADPEAALTARRELHALKGAARMIGLADLGTLCHRAEELAGRDGASPDPEALVAAVDEIVREIEALRPRAEMVETPAGAAGGGAETRPADPLDLLQAPLGQVDRVTELATRIKILTAGMAKPVSDIRALATLAEHGVREQDPAQALAALAASLRHVRDRLENLQIHMVQVSREQLERLLELQMQPLEPTLLELARHARELAADLGKEVRVTTSGGAVRLDRRITGALLESLRHLVRNAVDHGIEPPDERERQGKPRAGNLEIQARQAGARVLVILRDDGRGLDLEAIRQEAARRGLTTAGSGEDSLAELVLLPGFTTRREVSEVSGRGIGLDAVASAVRSLGGSLHLESKPGSGLRVTLDLPAARRGRRILVASLHDLLIGVPVSMVRAYHPASAVTVSDPSGDGHLHGVVGSRSLPVLLLWATVPDEGWKGLFLELDATAGEALLPVTSVKGVEEVLARPAVLRERLGPFFQEAAVLGSGVAVPILTLGETMLASEVSRAGTGSGGVRRLRVLLVDDSPVTREMERRLLEDAGLFVEAVADGAMALARLASSEFDCLVTDIEMPRMDGLELTRAVRSSERYANLPIVLVSTRNRPEDRQAGLEAGADAYMAKQELAPGELPSLIRRLTGVPV